MDEHDNKTGSQKQGGWTPGPWYEEEAGICADSWGCVAQANYPESYWERGGEGMTPAEVSEHAANSRLIAAAPDLYDACAALVAALDASAPLSMMRDIVAAGDAARTALSRANPSTDQGGE